MFRTYDEMMELSTFKERYDYLKLGSDIGVETFGFDRYLNQRFYRSSNWKNLRHHIIARDLGRDLGIEGHEIFDKVLIHHINPIGPEDIHYGTDLLLNPQNLITVSHKTHNAIHFGDGSYGEPSYKPRSPGDTTLW